MPATCSSDRSRTNPGGKSRERGETKSITQAAWPPFPPKAAFRARTLFLVINVFDCMALQVFPLLVFSSLKVLLMCASRFLFVAHVMWCFLSV